MWGEEDTYPIFRSSGMRAGGWVKLATTSNGWRRSNVLKIKSDFRFWTRMWMDYRQFSCNTNFEIWICLNTIEILGNNWRVRLALLLLICDFICGKYYVWHRRLHQADSSSLGVHKMHKLRHPPGASVYVLRTIPTCIWCYKFSSDFSWPFFHPSQ